MRVASKRAVVGGWGDCPSLFLSGFMFLWPGAFGVLLRVQLFFLLMFAVFWGVNTFKSLKHGAEIVVA